MRTFDALLTYICLIGGAVVGTIGLIGMVNLCELIPHGWDCGALICGYGLSAISVAMITAAKERS